VGRLDVVERGGVSGGVAAWFAKEMNLGIRHSIVLKTFFKTASRPPGE
jgi:hypothetical protein